MLSNLIRTDFPLMEVEYDKSIIDLSETIKKTLEESASIAVVNAADVLSASHYLKIYKHFTRKGEEIRKKCVDPFNYAVKEINSFFKKIYGTYSAEESRLEHELLCFNEQQVIKAEAAKKELQKQMEEAAIQKAIEIEELQKLEALKNGIPLNEIKTVEIPEIKEFSPEIPKLSAGNLSGISTARIKKWKVTDLTLIPIKYLAVNETLMNSVRKEYGFDEKSPIAGIEFYFETIIK